MIMYGGQRGRLLDDMWVLDTVSVRWSRFGKSADHPGKRTGHAAVVIGDKMWIFGGETENHECLNDLWVFDLGNSKKWEQVLVGGKAPPPRCGHAAVAFGDTILVFGGLNYKLDESFGDLWYFELASSSWSQINTGTASGPPARHGHTMTMVSSSRVLLFGGYGQGGRLNDLWQLDPFTLQWSRIETCLPVPSRRAYHSAVSLRFKLIVFGGQGAAAMGDLWQFSPTSSTWTKLEASRWTERASIMENVVGPAARYGHSGEVFGSDKMFIFGGVGDGSVYRDDLWFLYVDLSLSEPLEIETPGADSGLAVSLPPVNSSSYSSAVPSHESITAHDAQRTKEDEWDNRGDMAGRDLSSMNISTNSEEGEGGRLLDSLLTDELSQQLEKKVSTGTRNFLLEENRRWRELATRMRHQLWETFTAGLDIGLPNEDDNQIHVSLTDTDLTRMLKEAHILDDDKDMSENDIILASYYASSFEKKLKRLELRLHELKERAADQEREIKHQKHIRDSQNGEMVSYFEAKLEHEMKALEKRLHGVLLEHQGRADENMVRIQEQVMMQILEQSRGKDKTESREHQDAERTSERLKRLEDHLGRLTEEMSQMKESWRRAEEEEIEEEGRLEEFETTLKEAMEGANALGSLMNQYFLPPENDDRFGLANGR